MDIYFKIGKTKIFKTDFLNANITSVSEKRKSPQRHGDAEKEIYRDNKINKDKKTLFTIPVNPVIPVNFLFKTL